jgi:hypothetical protein
MIRDILVNLSTIKKDMTLRVIAPGIRARGNVTAAGSAPSCALRLFYIPAIGSTLPDCRFRRFRNIPARFCDENIALQMTDHTA